MYAIFVTVKVKPEERERFLAAIEHDAICSERDEPNCYRFNVLQDQSDPDTYYFYEVYRDDEGFQEHTRTPHLAKWREAAEVVLQERSGAIRMHTVFPRDPAYWEKKPS